MTNTQFSKTYGIPLRSVENWKYGVTKCPDYIIELLSRAVIEDQHIESLDCYDKNMLKELGYLYAELLKIVSANKKLKPYQVNPYRCAEIFPTKYFTILHNTAARVGIPKNLCDRIALFFDHIDPDDWAKSMDIPVPTAKQQYFLMQLMGLNK